MISSPTQVETEVHNIVRTLPRLKPFDLSIRLDTSLDVGAWRVPYSRIGFDVTLVHSTTPSSSSPSEAATFNESDLRLRDGEKKKFARRTGGTNDITNRTLTADEVIGEILSGNNVFIPVAIGPFGELGSLFRRFIENCTTLPLPNFSASRPHAHRAAKLAIHCRTPSGVFDKADRMWKHNNNLLFDGSYLSNTPGNWANQKLGLALVTHLSNHINTSMTKVKMCGISQSQDLGDESFMYDYGDNDWNFYDGNFDRTMERKDSSDSLVLLSLDTERT